MNENSYNFDCGEIWVDYLEEQGQKTEHLRYFLTYYVYICDYFYRNFMDEEIFNDNKGYGDVLVSGNGACFHYFSGFKYRGCFEEIDWREYFL